VIISAAAQAIEPEREGGETPALDLDLSAILDTIGPKGTVVLLALGSFLLWRVLRRLGGGRGGRTYVYPAGERHRLLRWVGRLFRGLMLGVVRFVRITLWSAWMRLPIRLAHRLQPDRWVAMCEARKLTGLKRGKVRRTPMGVDVHIKLGGSLRLDTLVARVPDLETGLGVRRGSVRIEPTEYAHKALVRITVRNPLARPVPWVAPVGPVSITDPAKLSMNAFGEWTELDLQQRILIVGASGAGKSSVQRVLAAPVVMAYDADLEVWDLKQGTESQHYEGRATVRVTTADECRVRIAHLREVEIPRRARILQELGTSTWPTSATHRDLVIVVDEGAALIRDLELDELRSLFTLLEQARAYGIYLWWATQYPKSSNLPTELRSQMSAVVGLKVRRASESRVVFEDLVREGWAPHRLRGKGWLLLLDDEHSDPEETRAAWLDERQFRALTPMGGASPAPAAAAVPPMPTEPPGPAILPPSAHEPTVGLRPVGEGDYLLAPPLPAPVAPAPAPPAPAAEELDTPEAVAVALITAPAGGMTVAELVMATGRQKSQVYSSLQQLQDEGRAVRVARGRYGLPTTEAGEVTG
jgi:hypothetical protein